MNEQIEHTSDKGNEGINKHACETKLCRLEGEHGLQARKEKQQ